MLTLRLRAAPPVIALLSSSTPRPRGRSPPPPRCRHPGQSLAPSPRRRGNFLSLRKRSNRPEARWRSIPVGGIHGHGLQNDLPSPTGISGFTARGGSKTPLTCITATDTGLSRGEWQLAREHTRRG
jgi:hypothetical protein